MKKRKPLTNKDGEVRELMAEDFAAMRPTAEVLPELVASWRKRGERGPQKSPRKVPISIRLSPDVAKGLRATGNGWQGRADEALRSWLATGQL